MDETRMDAEQEKGVPVDSARLREFDRLLRRCKAGKASIERRVIAAENWWRLRNSAEEDRESESGGEGFRCVSGWLHNVIVSKHADAMEAYPEPVILPREKNDRAEAKTLSAIVPVVLEENRFEDVYSDSMWQKLKTGTAVYRVTWDASKLNGMGDIAIERVNLLNIFWEPGVDDIQKSRYVFCTRYEAITELEEKYPQLRGKLKPPSFRPSEYREEDAPDRTDKALVVDVYYHKTVDGRSTLQFCRYTGDSVIYATENEEGAPGLYDHGRYPFVFDALFPVEGSPCGYGFIDLCKNAQTRIDLMQTAFVKNTLVGALPRYFMRGDGSVNEREFLDLEKSLVHTDGNLGEDTLRSIDYRPLSGNYIEMMSSTVEELRQTSGNTETSTGNIGSGVTAASAIAALQEASGKGSRDAIRTSYRAYREIVELCIELIRQFYTLPRQFRITGDSGEEFISYDSFGIRPSPQGSIGGIELGSRLPVFDIRVEAARKNAYSRLSQNELAMEMYRMGMFNPDMAEQALMCLDMMEFDGKDAVSAQIGRQRELMGVLAGLQARLAQGAAESASITEPRLTPAESAEAESARASANNAPLPGGGVGVG